MNTNNSKLKIIELFRISGNDEEAFIHQVKVNNAWITMLVHPFYSSPSEELFEEIRAPYLDKLSRLITECAENDKPLVIFEENGSVNLLEQRLPSNIRGKIYIVNTFTASPCPYYISREYPTLIPWIAYARLLRLFSVKSINIGGRFLQFFDINSNSWGMDKYRENEHQQLIQQINDKQNAPAWFENGIVPGGCVGTAARRLGLLGFDFTFSTASSPAVLY